MLKALFLSLALLAPAWAQPDTSLLRDYAQTRGFLNGRPQKARLAPDGKSAFFLRSEARSKQQSFYEYSLATGKTRLLLAPGGNEKLTPEEKARRERMRLQTSGYSDYAFDKTGKRILLPLSGKLQIYSRPNGGLRTLPIQGSVLDPKWTPDGKAVSYIKGQDLYLFDLQSGQERALTTGGSLEKTHGLSEFVAQEEMSRLTGYWWSPDGRQVAYEEADHRGVEVWNISDPSHPETLPARQYYPRPGHPNVKARLGILTVATGQTTWLSWDRRRFEYLGAVRWDKAGPLTIQLQDRKQQRLSLFQVDPSTGQLTLLQEETDPRWVNLSQSVPVWLPGAKGYFWIRGEKLGLVQGKQWQPLTDITEFVGYDAKRGIVHVRTDEQPGNPHALSFKLDGEKVSPCALEGVSEVAFRPGHAERLLTSHTVESLPRTYVVGADGKTLGELPGVAAEPAQDLHVQFQALGGYNTALVRPKDFQPGRKYPVVMDVYGGPHHLHVVRSRRNWIVDQWLADQGFLVVAVDNRGTPGKGVEWERAVYGQFGSVPLDDQVKGLQELGKQFAELDLAHVGMVGWSFGGYLSAQSVLKRPDIFQAACAGAPVTDWGDYDTHYTERYMGLLPESRKAYDEASLLPLAKNLNRPLLLVHGTADDNVYYRNSLRLADALFRAGRPFEAVPLPGITHSYTSDSLVTERLWIRVAEFFRKSLAS